jgi:predicted aldo/keto reductase-like oxidoreductase
MEPVKGGSLAKPLPPVAEVLNTADPKVSPSSWAIRFAASLDNVITVLSGMSNLDRMEDNLATMSNFKPLTDAEYTVIERAREALDSIENIPCTSCNYCTKDCPQGVVIPIVFEAMNHYLVFDNLKYAKQYYRGMLATQGGSAASKCVECGQCESACPQHISIRKELK